MKSSASIQQKGKSKITRTSSDGVKKASQVSRKISSSKVTRRSPLVVAKRYGKQTLRAMLLSKMFHTTFKVVVGIGVSYAALHGAYMFIGRSFADDVVVSQSEIIARIAKLTDLPHETPDDIVRVQNPEDLRKQNSFYENIKEGDYIVMYPKLAVIYDLRNNSIVGIKKSDK
jgi:hypothetical protein